MAEVEYEEGIRSTYFFLLRTNHYNLVSREGTSEVQRIIELGHNLGLHFDCAAYAVDTTEDDLCAACGKEADLLGSWFGRPVEVVSFHRPSSLVLTGNPALSAPRPHTYMACFMKEMNYCSDSRGEWRHGAPQSQAAFMERKPMQILIHPVWWSANGRGAKETLSGWLDRQIDSLEDSMAANCTIYAKRSRERSK
jgi:hypothetical protein